MKSKIKSYLFSLSPLMFNSDEINIGNIQSPKLGESNLNYKIEINQKQFVLRVNVDPNSPSKSHIEYNNLKFLERLDFAPKVYFYENNPEILGGTFILIDFFEGQNLVNIKIDDNIIRKLAQLVATFHNQEISNNFNTMYRPNDLSIQDFFSDIEKMHNYLIHKWKKYNLSEKFGNFLTNCRLRVQDNANLKSRITTLCHCDIAPQNVILCNDRLKLIDWESLRIADPAIDLAMLFDSFDFTVRKREYFLRNYLKIREDSNLKIRINQIWPIHILNIFYWSLVHVFEIKDKEFSPEFTSKQSLTHHINYSKKMFEKCKEAKIFDNSILWDDFNILPKTI